MGAQFGQQRRCALHGAMSVIEEQVTNGVAVRMAVLYGVATPVREDG